MWPVEWHHCRWRLVTRKATFAVWNLSISHTSGNTARIIYDVFTWIGKRTWLVILTIFSKTKDLSRSHPVRYTINVAIYRKRCQILLQTEVIYGLLNRCNSGDLEWPFMAIPAASLQVWLFVHLCSGWQYFNWHSTWRGPSAVTVLLVILWIHSNVTSKNDR